MIGVNGGWVGWGGRDSARETQAAFVSLPETEEKKE